MSLNTLSTFISSLMSSGSSAFICEVSLFSSKTGGIFSTILTFITGLIYNVAKWVLFIVDCIFAFIQQLCGLDMDLSSLEAATSSSSDFVFNLINSGWDTIYPIIMALIGMAVFLIIFFSIIAVIRTQYEATKGGKGTLGDIFKTMFRAFVFLILTPFISIVSIIASNALLQTLYNATNVDGSTSIGAHVFAASATSANSYRIYASSGERIPIIYNFNANGASDIISYYSSNSLSEEAMEYLKSSDNVIYMTYTMFNTDDFISFNSINTLLTSDSEQIKTTKGVTENSYYSVYDIPTDAVDSDGNIINEDYRITAYMEEYFVMADVIDSAMATSSTIYFMTIEDIVNNFPSEYYLDTDGDGVLDYSTYDKLWSELQNYGIKAVSISDDGKYYTYTSEYYSIDDGGNPNIPMQIEYNHVIGATDEAYGAKYIVAIKKTSTIAGKEYTYYWPLVSGSNEDTFGSFSSDYIKDGQIISAKGIFDSGTYPTAIRKNSEGNIEFYRDTIDTIAIGMAGEMFSYDYVSSSGGFSRLFSFVKSLFSADDMTLDVNFDFDSIDQTYTTEISIIQELTGQKMTICYFMAAGGTLSSSVSTYLTSSIYGINITNIYNTGKINYLILIVGTIILLKVCLSAVLNLVGRSFELFLMFIFYPTACATLPIDNGSYNRWMSNYIQRLLGTYGFILGINFIFILFPVIESIEFFTAADIANTKIIQKMGSLIYSICTDQQIATFLNFVLAIVMELVALSMLKRGGKKGEKGSSQSFADIINGIVGGQATEGAGEAFMSSVSSTVKTVTAPIRLTTKVTKTVATGAGKVGKGIKDLKSKSAKEIALEAAGAVGKHLPGSAIVNDAAQKAAMHKAHQKENKQDNQDIANAMK